MSTHDDNLKSAFLNLSHALRDGTPEERKEAMLQCHQSLESTLDQEDLIGLAIIIRETHSGLRVTTVHELEYVSKEEFHLHIAWDLVLPSLAEKQFISLKRSPVCSDSMEIEHESEVTEEQNHIVILRLPLIESPSGDDARSGFSSNKQYVMSCLQFLDDVIEVSQSESEEDEEEETKPKNSTRGSEELDAKYAQLRSRGKATDPLPPLETLCDLLDLQKTEFLILLLVLKAELDSNPLDVRTLVELLASDIVEQYELKKLLQSESKLIKAKLIFLDDTQRYAKVLVMMPPEVVDYLINGGTPPSHITKHHSHTQLQQFRDNEQFLDAWLEIARMLLEDLEDIPLRLAKRKKAKSGGNTPPASQIESIQHILDRIKHFGSAYPLGRIARDLNLTPDECIILSLALYGAVENMHIPVEAVLSLLAGDHPLRKVQYERLCSPDAALVKAGIMLIRTGSHGEATVGVSRSRLHDILDLPQESRSLPSSPFFEHKTPEHSLDDVILPSDIRQSINTAIESMRPEVIDRLQGWGISGSGASKQISLLLHGDPGVGKSMTASAVAHALGCSVLSVHTERFLSKWHGESEQNLAMIFETYDHIAQRIQPPPVLLLEECDQLMARRDRIGSTNTDRSEHRLISILLDKIEHFVGILIGTSNLVDAGAIDSAFSRRFHHKIRFPFPDIDARYALWQAHIPSSVPVRGTIDFRALAERYAFSGGQIRIVCLAALRKAAIRDGYLTQTDIMHACEAELNNNFEQRGLPGMQPIGFHR